MANRQRAEARRKAQAKASRGVGEGGGMKWMWIGLGVVVLVVGAVVILASGGDDETSEPGTTQDGGSSLDDLPASPPVTITIALSTATVTRVTRCLLARCVAVGVPRMTHRLSGRGGHVQRAPYM